MLFVEYHQLDNLVTSLKRSKILDDILSAGGNELADCIQAIYHPCFTLLLAKKDYFPRRV